MKVIPGIDQVLFVLLFAGCFVKMINRHIAAHQINVTVDVPDLTQSGFSLAQPKKHLLGQILSQLFIAEVFDKKSENFVSVLLKYFFEVHALISILYPIYSF